VLFHLSVLWVLGGGESVQPDWREEAAKPLSLNNEWDEGTKGERFRG
jgi:hypothetical protein